MTIRVDEEKRRKNQHQNNQNSGTREPPLLRGFKMKKFFPGVLPSLESFGNEHRAWAVTRSRYSGQAPDELCLRPISTE